MENHIETFAIKELQSLGWQYVIGIAPSAETQERESFEQIEYFR